MDMLCVVCETMYEHEASENHANQIRANGGHVDELELDRASEPEPDMVAGRALLYVYKPVLVRDVELLRDTVGRLGKDTVFRWEQQRVCKRLPGTDDQRALVCEPGRRRN